MTNRRRRRQSGFTLIEILVSLVILTIGVVGIMALQLTLVRSNRMSRELEQAKVYASQVMEVIRRCNVTTLSTCNELTAVTTPITTSDNVTYTRSYAVSALAVPSDPNGLVLVTTTATFYEDGNAANAHSATMQMVRTTVDPL